VSVPNFLTKATRQTVIAVMIVATTCYLAISGAIPGETFLAGVAVLVVAADFKKS
jgi:hypothetical protein